MSDRGCAEFLAWALPRLHLRWAGFRNLRGQVCKRLRRRIAELGLPDLDAYRARLEQDPSEWAALDALCFVTISRVHRDAAVWEALRAAVLPELAEQARRAGENTLRCWSIGCASGEEPYTLSIVWALGVADRFPAMRLRVLATDRDEAVLERARAAIYPEATLRELPRAWRDRAFDPATAGATAGAPTSATASAFRLKDDFRAPVEIRRHDVRSEPLDANERFHLILCRNVVFTYFDEASQGEMLARLVDRLEPGGVLVIGHGERLPETELLTPIHSELGVFRRAAFGALEPPA